MNKMIINLLLLFVTIPGISFAYNLPTGIPDPGFGLDAVKPARPDPWISEVTGYYYVEDTDGCSESAHYGYPGHPRCYIPNPIPAGSYVEVHGTYSHIVGGIIKVQGTGTSEHPIWFVGQDEDHMPTFTRKLFFIGSYIYAEHLHSYVTRTNDSCFAIGSGGHSGYKGDHIMLRNSIGESDNNYKSHGFDVSGYHDDESEEADYILAYNNVFRNFGIFNAEIDLDAHVVVVNKWAKHVWILDNTIYHSGGSGVAIGQEGPLWHYTDVQWVFIGRNHVYDTTQAGIAIKGAWHVVFSENTVHDQVTRWDHGIVGGSWLSPSKCFGWKGEPQDFWIINNTCYNNSYGVHGGATIPNNKFNIYIVGNTFKHIIPNRTSDFTGTNPSSEAAISMVRGGNVYAINNSIYDSSIGITAIAQGGEEGEIYNFYIENNIIEKINYAHMVLASRAVPDQTYVKSNIIYQPDGSPELIRWRHDYTGDVPAWQAASGTGQNTLLTDPKYTDPENNNFNLQADSPAIDAGLSENELSFDIYQKFQDTFGLDIRKDINGVHRPQGAGWDIGAYEFVGDSVNGGSSSNDVSAGGLLLPPSGFELKQ